MNSVQAAIDRLAAISPVHSAEGDQQFALLPTGYSLKDISVPTVPDRIIRHEVFHDGDSLAGYADRFKVGGTLLMADIANGRVAIIFDYHAGPGPEDVNACDHTGVWELFHSEELRAWGAWEGKLHAQEDFIQFLEENLPDVIAPDPAALMDLCRDFNAVKTTQFKSSKRLDNGDRAFVYTDDTQAKGEISVPKDITLSIPLYEGEEAVNVPMKFRYRFNDGGLRLGFQFHRFEPIKRAAFRAAVARVAENTGLPPHYGEAARPYR